MRCRAVLFTILASLVASLVSAQQTTRGRDFYVVFLPNYHNGGDSATDSLYIFVVADQPTSGTITATNNLGQTRTTTFTITDPQQIFIYRVQYRSYELFGYNNNGTFVTPNENERISPRVFRVTTDRDVAVYALNQALTTSDATLVLPVTTLGTEYYVMSYNTDGILLNGTTLSTQTTPSEFAIVGVEDGTDVTIYPTAPTTESGMQIKSVRLDRGQAMLFQAQFSTQNLNYDLTGTRIVASKKIAVFAGHQRALVPVQARGQLASRDQLYEQMIPLSVWGTTYIITPLAEPQGAPAPTQSTSDIYRVLAAENGTEIKINGRVVAVLQRGQFYQAPLLQAALLEASKPVMVALFKRSFSGTSNLQLGDPLMMIIPPRRQYLSKYRFQSCQVAHPSGGNTYYEQYITVVTTPNNVRSILLDGDTLRADFKEVPNTCYVYANVRVTDGAHTIESPRLFGLYVYGYGYADSYGYIGGMAFLPDVPDITVSAGPDHDVCLGDSVTLAVTGNAYAVKWSVAPGYPAVTIPCDTCHQITIAPRATTKLILTGTDSLGCSVTDDVMITVYGKPQIQVRPDTVVCSDIPITIGVEGNFQTVQWQPTEGLGCSVCPQTTVTPQPGKEIVYTAIARNANSPNCETRDSIRVRYAPGLFGKLPPMVTLCRGDSVTLTLDYGGRVRWTPSQGLSCTDCKTVTIRPDRTTRYTVVGDSADCTTQASIEVRVEQKPTLQPLADTSICAGESVQLQLVTTNAERIVISPAVEVSCTGCSTPLFTPTQTRTYTVTVSAGSGTGECTVSDTMTIVVRSRPRIELATTSLVLCAGDTARIAAHITDADSVAWEPTDGILCPTCDTTAIVGTASRTYTVTAWSSDGCSSNATVTVTVNPRPTLQVAPLDTTVCAGSVVQLSATSDGTIEWDRSLPIACYDCPQVELIATESRTIAVRSRNTAGCITEGTVVLDVRPLPAVTLPDSIRLCIGKSVHVQPTGTQAAYRYRWQPSDGLSCSDCPDPIAAPNASTRYVLTTTTPDGCTDSDTVTVSVVPCRVALRSRVDAVTKPVWTCGPVLIVVSIVNPLSDSDQDVLVEFVGAEILEGSGVLLRQMLSESVGSGGEDLLPTLPRLLPLGKQWTYSYLFEPTTESVTVGIRIRSAAGDTMLFVPIATRRQQIALSVVPRVPDGQPLVPGGTLEYSLLLDAPQWDFLAVRRIGIELKYPANLLYYAGQAVLAQRSDLDAGWQIVATETADGDSAVLSIVAFGPVPLTTSGELGRITMGTLLGNTYRIEPQPRIDADSSYAACVQTAATVEAVTMQTCVRELRFVRISTTGFQMRSVAPNPASESVTIEYEIGYDAPVRIELVDVVGRVVAEIFDSRDRMLSSGRYVLTASLGELPAGMYRCRLMAGQFCIVEPLMIVR